MTDGEKSSEEIVWNFERSDWCSAFDWLNHSIATLFLARNLLTAQPSCFEKRKVSSHEWKPPKRCVNGRIPFGGGMTTVGFQAEILVFSCFFLNENSKVASNTKLSAILFLERWACAPKYTYTRFWSYPELFSPWVMHKREELWGREWNG